MSIAAPSAHESLSPEHRVVLYDGVCALCNGAVTFVLARDRSDRYRFAALQSDVGRAFMERHGRDPDAVDTLGVVLAPGTDRERLLVRSRAALSLATDAGGAWRLFAVLRVVPTFLLDLGYRLVARLRYRLFGKYDACPVPAPEHRHKFL